LRVDTAGYGGRKITKHAGVYTNEKTHPRYSLTITGQVERFATVSPRTVSLRGFVGDSIRRTVRIQPSGKHPFKITGVRARNGRYIDYRLETKRNGNGRAEYLLQVENRRRKPGRYSDTVILDTDNKIRPQLFVRVFGHLKSRPDAGVKK